jgi:tRNA(Ile)-lysidine synthetase-like protein
MDDSLPEAVSAALRARRVVLAVSGGRDSVSLMHAALDGAPDAVACVACFDHGTGPHARRASTLVRRMARARGVEFVTARAAAVGRSEAEWRSQRWRFLRAVARERGAQVATAHTRDDQVETVLMRIMRGAGARGIAALAADGPVVRPLLHVGRAEVERYARAHRLAWVEDPGNRRADHLRNRVRRDLLPAIARVRPSFADELTALGHRAAHLRARVELFLDRVLELEQNGDTVLVARSILLRYDAPALALLWPAIAARAGATLDRRGTDRLVAFTRGKRNGARAPLSGGFEAVAHRGSIVIRRAAVAIPEHALGLGTGVRLGSFQFDQREAGVSSLWSARLPVGKRLTVRAWQPGDRMVPVGGDARRVKGLLRDAGVDAASRLEWPVVLADDEIVWVPGVRRSSAASARSGRPVVTYHCERIDR